MGLYDQRLLVTEGGQIEGRGTLDKRSGIFTAADAPTPPGTIYQGRADVQDPGLLLSRNAEGQQIIAMTNDLTCYLPKGTFRRLKKPFQEGQNVVIFWPSGRTLETSIVKVMEMDESLRLRGDNGR